MDFNNAKKLSLIVNTSLLIFVTCMLGLYSYWKLTALVYLSFGAISVYILGYFLIYINRLEMYVWIVYLWIVFYMCVCTVCMGYDYGFHLYCMSLIPIIFYTDYIAYKINTKNPRAFLVSMAIVIFYILSNGYTILNGPVYTINNKVASFFLIVNSLSVFAFLISYTLVMIKAVKNSEEKLRQMALHDKLTGMYNRHFMIEHLNHLIEEKNTNNWIAIVDIDDFKKINDTYGHNYGDYVLTHLCELMREHCVNCTMSRWGGEEFLITNDGDATVLDDLREAVAGKDFKYQDSDIKVTVTIGAAQYGDNYTLDNWIHKADKNLYFGKNNGKNQVVR